MPFAEVVELALYHPEHGFYTSGGRAGRRGDFITSPEVGPLFGQVVANALDAEWARLANPEVFTVVEAGAGPGTLARSILAAKPQCSDALQYIALERSAAQREQHPAGVESTDELPWGITGVVLANELLDNLSFTPLRNVDGALVPGFVYERDGSLCLDFPADRLVEATALAERHGDLASRLKYDQSAAATWVANVLDTVLAVGSLIVIDYARFVSEEVEVRTYAGHARAGDLLEQLGTKDITVDVDLEQLQAQVRPADRILAQAEWLGDYGIEELVDEGRQIWEASASVGDLAALKARSRVREADALTDPAGLGAFVVAEWRRANHL